MKTSMAMAAAMAAILVVGCGGSPDKAAGGSGKSATSEDREFQDCLDAAFMSTSQNQDDKTAIAFYDKAIALRPNYGNAYHNRGCLYVKLGEVDKGIKDLDRAIALNPQDAMAHANRSVAYDRKGNRDASKADSEKARALDPKVDTSSIVLRISDVSPVITFQVVDGKIVKK